MRVVYLLLCMLFSQITWANDSDLMLLVPMKTKISRVG